MPPGACCPGAAAPLTGPTTPESARVHVHDAPGAEVGPGQVAAWGRATADRAEAFGCCPWERSGMSSEHFPFDWTGPDWAWRPAGTGRWRVPVPQRRVGPPVRAP